MPYVTRIDNGNEISIHYNVVGDKEPMVLHHGNGNSIEDWYTLGFVEELSKYYQLVLIDSRGYGKSSKPHNKEEYNLKSRADDTISVLDALGISEAHCFGASVGASYCMLLAKHYPLYVKSCILATPYFTQLDESSKTALKLGTEAYVTNLEKKHKTQIDNKMLRNTILANDAKALIAANSSEWFDYLDYAKYLTMPTLIYCGDQEPTVENLIKFSSQLPNYQFHILPDVDHKTAYWDSKLVTPLISQFLNNQE